MQPHVIVINEAGKPQRWFDTMEAIVAVGGFPLRWLATTPDMVGDDELVEWRGLAPVKDQKRRVAITRSYRRLMQWLPLALGDEWVVMQDDVVPVLPFDRESTAPIHIYGGMDVQYGDELVRVCPWGADHVHPRAFRVRREALPWLEKAWSDESRVSCEAWIPWLNEDVCTYDDPPGVIDAA